MPTDRECFLIDVNNQKCKKNVYGWGDSINGI